MTRFVVLLLVLQRAAWADAPSCAKYAKALSAASFKEVVPDKDEMAKRFGVPRCLDVLVCFAYYDDPKYHVDLGVLLANKCSSSLDVTVWLPKKAKGSTDPDPESVTSNDHKKKAKAGSTTLRPEATYEFGTISKFSREVPVSSILLATAPAQ